MAQGQLNPKITHTFLQQHDDSPEWKMSEFTQLDSYERLGIFGIPCEQPRESNVQSLIWTYTHTLCGTKNSGCVCNGSPKMKGSVNLSHTYSAAFEQPGARTLWVVIALHYYLVYGVDVTNVFAEAPPPKTPLYVTIEKNVGTDGSTLNMTTNTSVLYTPIVERNVRPPGESNIIGQDD